MQKYFLVVSLWIFAMASSSEPQDLRRDVNLNSGYAEKLTNSNEALVHAPLSVIQGYSKLFDVVTADFRDHWAKRLVNVLLSAPISYWLAPALSTSFHEFGHARVWKALGVPYSYGSVSYGHHFRDLNSFWTLAAIRLITPPWPVPGYGLAYTAGPTGSVTINEDLYFAKGETAGFTIMLVGAGINNQMHFAKALATTLYENNGHPLYLANYVEGKLHGFVYAVNEGDDNGDPSRVVKAYHDRGWRINHNHLKTLSLVSLLSGSTFALLYGYYNYLLNDDEVVRPIEFYGFRFPEVNGYINAAGLSFELESDYRFSANLSVGLGYEFMWKGQIVHEVTPRVRYNFASILPSLNELWFKSSLVIGKGLGGSMSVDLAPIAFDTRNFWSRLSYGFDVNLHHAGTLYGERNITALNQGNSMAMSAFTAIKLRY